MIVSAVLLTAAALTATAQDTTVRDTVIFLDEVIVSGTRSPQTQRLDQPLSLAVGVPTLATRASGSVAAHLLRDLPGVFVQQTSAGQGAVVLRGMIGNQVLVLVDGVPMNNGTYRDGPGQYLATIDPETIERIEVVRGPASTLYGSDAQGGVVNIITSSHQPTNRPRSVRVVGVGSSADHSLRGRVSLGYTGARWTLGAGGTLATVGDLRAGGDVGPQDPTGFGMAGFDANLTVTPTPMHTIRGSLQHFTLSDVPRYDRYVTFRSPTVGSDAEHLFNPQTRQLAFARHTYAPMRAGLTRLQTTVSLATQREGRSRIPLDDTGQPSDERTWWRDDVYTPGASIVGSSFLMVGGRSLVVSWGGDWQHDILNSEGTVETVSTGVTTPLLIDTDRGPMPTGNFPDGAEADRLGIFISGDAVLSQLVRVTAGGRWSRFHNQATLDTDFGGAVSNSSADLTAQLGVVITPADSWRIVARVAEGFRAPNLYDLTRVGPVPGGVALPNPNAEPERSLSGELGVRYAASQVALEVSAYYTRVTDFIDRVPGEFQGDTLFNGERVFQGRNVGTARIRGVEAEGATVVGPFRFRASMLFTHGEQEAAAGGDEPMSKIPPLTGLMSVRWNIPVRALSLEYLVRWATRQNRLSSRDLRDPRIPAEGTPGYAVHGIRASAAVSPTLSVSAGLENLTDALYRTHASGVDGAGRHVWLGLSVVGGL